MAKTKRLTPESDSLAEETLQQKPKRGRYASFKDAAAAQEAEKQGKPRPVAKAVRRSELQKLSTDGDLVDIWERRILNPNHHESHGIRIKTPGMTLRWINLRQPGRFQRARYEQGWVPVHRSELSEEREIYGATYTSEGYVCRGEKQSEMLMKMPEAVYKRIQKRRAELNQKSYAKLRDNLGSAGHQHFSDKYGSNVGDIAAEAAGRFVGTLKFGTEKATTTELFE